MPFPAEGTVERLASRVGVDQRRRAFHERLSEGVERVIRRSRDGRPMLRRLVSELTRDAVGAGISRDEVRASLVEFISQHPLCDRFDRICLTDGRSLADRLIAHVEHWITVA